MEESKKKSLLSPKTEELLARQGRAMEGGGAEKVQAQRGRGKLLARERLDLLLDDDSFEELDLLMETRSRVLKSSCLEGVS